MDRLFKRYACPFPLMDGYIQTSRFREFIRAFIAEKNEDDKWDFFLHKVWDKSYDEYSEALQNSQKQMDMTENEIEATVKKSIDILGAFNPEKERE